jgi:hypothetical protein
MRVMLGIYYLVLGFVAAYVDMNVAAVILIASGLQELDQK